MEVFEEVQKLFDAYQKNGDFHNLRDSLDILDEVIESKSAESHKAINFKKTIAKHIDNQVKGVIVKCNIRDFAKDLKDIDDQDLLLEKLASVLSASFSKEDGKTFFELLNIQSDYFKQIKNQE